MIYIQFSFNFHNAKKKKKKRKCNSAPISSNSGAHDIEALVSWGHFCSLEQQQHCFSAWDTWVSGERQVSVRVQGYQTG